MLLQPIAQAAMPIDVEKTMRVAARKLAAHDAANSDKTAYPTEAKGATWKAVPPEDWVSGFYPGTLWYLHEYAKLAGWPDADAWRKMAETWTAGLEGQQFNNTNHDTGFMVFDSFGNGFRITQNPAYPPIIKRTAQSLASRFRKETGCIRSWGKISDMKTFTVIIDNMMNLELLLWSAANGATLPDGTSEDLRNVAIKHADRTIDLFFRPDGSTYHVVELNPATGEVLKKRTHQGKADESTWSRGQTWAIYGFAYMAEATNDPRYLATSIKAADYYLKHLPADRVPPSDFNSTLTGLEFKDSSAAAIACSAFFRLARIADKESDRKRFREAAVATLEAITRPPYFSDSPDKASLLVYAARNYNEDPNHHLTNTSLIWGDYYLLESLLQYRVLQNLPKP
jgi:hypothetical protein